MYFNNQNLWLDLHKERKGNLCWKKLMIKTSNKPNFDQMLESYIGLCDLEVLCWMSPNYIEGMQKNLFVMIRMGSTQPFPLC